MAVPRDPGRFPVFATCPVVMLAHGLTIARSTHRGGRLPQLHRRGPSEDSLQALATVGVEREAWSVISPRSAKTRMGRQIVSWSRRPQARKRPCDGEGNRPGDHEPRLWRATSFRDTGPKLAGDPFRGLLAALDALGHADSVIGVAGERQTGVRGDR